MPYFLSPVVPTLPLKGFSMGIGLLPCDVGVIGGGVGLVVLPLLLA